MANNLYLNRTMEGIIKEASKYFSVISVTDPRQATSKFSITVTYRLICLTRSELR